MTTNLQQRLEKFLKDKEDFDGYVFGSDELLAFIKAELEELALECEDKAENYLTLDNNYGRAKSDAYKNSAAIIRNRANEI